ncbi:MAG TPA: helix-turn-helix transcriptional regulator [Pirellulales bacterium]|nr:helix-turn-helix transcriptional regulator [Pirellulales bacterium]
MPRESTTNGHASLSGHALRNQHLRQRALVRAAGAPPLARTIVQIRASTLDMTRLEFARRSGIGRGTMRDLELGVHTPTRQTLLRFVNFCQRREVAADQIEQLLDIYTGPCKSLEQFIARLELRAGSARELAKRVGISPSTLWEYRRGNFPLPWPLVEKLCRAVQEEPRMAAALWHAAERHRLIDRGYPEAWAELCVWCARANHPTSKLLKLGLTSASFRRLHYLELPPWPAVAKAAKTLACDDAEWRALEKLWRRDEERQRRRPRDDFGARLKQRRLARGIARRELADLFGIGGKKPARIIKYIEEDGYYSVRAFPAGLAAALAENQEEQEQWLELWRLRREQFTRRRRPETRIDLRLARELYGLQFRDVPTILGYSSLEYQRIERGVERLLDTARSRILEALHQAGRQRVELVYERLAERQRQRSAWQSPPTVRQMIALLAQSAGGLAPLAKRLRQEGLTGVSVPRLRAVVRGDDVPAWRLLEEIGAACEVDDLVDVRRDWAARYRTRLQKRAISPLGTEIRTLIAEVAMTSRAFSHKLPFNYSVLVRDLGRIDRDVPLAWFHVERIMNAAGLRPHHERWQEIRVLWCTVEARCNGARRVAAE